MWPENLIECITTDGRDLFINATSIAAIEADGDTPNETCVVMLHDVGPIHVGCTAKDFIEKCKAAQRAMADLMNKTISDRGHVSDV